MLALLKGQAGKLGNDILGSHDLLALESEHGAILIEVSKAGTIGIEGGVIVLHECLGDSIWIHMESEGGVWLGMDWDLVRRRPPLSLVFCVTLLLYTKSNYWHAQSRRCMNNEYIIIIYFLILCVDFSWKYTLIVGPSSHEIFWNSCCCNYICVFFFNLISLSAIINNFLYFNIYYK